MGRVMMKSDGENRKSGKMGGGNCETRTPPDAYGRGGAGRGGAGWGSGKLRTVIMGCGKTASVIEICPPLLTIVGRL